MVKSSVVYGYTRVSTDKQDAQRQHADILESANGAGLIVSSWIEETASSRKEEREIHGLIARLQEGDTVLVTELSRIGRSMRDINLLVSDCAKRGASIVTTNNGQRLGAGMDVAGEAMLFALGIGAQIERDLISERTKSGLRAARASGKVLGRPAGKSKLDVKAEEIRHLFSLGVTAANVAKIVGCSRGALAAWTKRNGGKVA